MMLTMSIRAGQRDHGGRQGGSDAVHDEPSAFCQ
jgi:hypothetical protein